MYLIANYAGAPVDPNGVAVHDHLLALWKARSPVPPGPGNATGRPSARLIAKALTHYLKRLKSLPSVAELLRADGWRKEFEASGAGLFTVRLESLGRKGTLLARGTHRFPRIAGAEVAVKLTGSGRQKLKRHAHLQAQLRASFQPPGGSTITRSARVATSGRQ